MGKGDKKTRRGKIIRKTYGNLRLNPRNIKRKKKMKITNSSSNTIKK
ncbi:30S ribosomal protein THX [Blattabacterium cuenoti]|nr:30S ribosomal protein THX [Blattabacterium cuenoti]